MAAQTRGITYGVLIFDGAEELDFAGPWEVFTCSSAIRDGADRVVLIAQQAGPVRCANGMRVLPDHTIDDHPALDVLLVPGGPGAHRTEPHNTVMTSWIAKVAAQAQWITSVCTGSILLHAAGPARGRRVATHWESEDKLEQRGDVTVIRDVRYIQHGNLVTSQGVSAGIDMALWLVGRIHGPQHSRDVRREIQYDPAPPYLAEVPAM